jgi:pyrimidine-nucleoside phosphorylase
MAQRTPRIHAVDLIRKTRDREALTADEIAFLVRGSVQSGTEDGIPLEQLAAWLMAVFHNGLIPEELAALTTAMRYSGEHFDARDLGKRSVDKHSTGGVGDKTSLIVAPIAAAAGLLDPMISGRALGHTGGTLDKLESIPGFRTDLSLAEMRRVLERTGACLVGQTASLVPADRTLYALRDRTATVESPYLICASILSKKLAAGLDGLVLDVKTGSGAFLRDPEAARFLATLMVETGTRAGTRTVALLTDMSQPLGATAGNWLEVAECCALLQGRASIAPNDDLLELSLELAAWMLLLGNTDADLPAARKRAEHLLASGAAWESFQAIVAAQGGDIRALDQSLNQSFGKSFEGAGGPGISRHTPVAEAVFRAPASGYLAHLDTTAIGWAVQRLGAGRVRAGEAVDPHAGIVRHARLGDEVTEGQPLFTLYATNAPLLAEPLRLFERAVDIQPESIAPPALIGEVIKVEQR